MSLKGFCDKGSPELLLPVILSSFPLGWTVFVTENAVVYL